MVVGQVSSGEVMSEDEDGRRLVDNWGGEQRSAVRHIGLVAWRLWHRSEQRTINRAEQHTSRSCFSSQAAQRRVQRAWRITTVATQHTV